MEVPLFLDSTEIVDSFAEAFSMRYSRIVVTAMDKHWLASAAQAFCGYGCSVIGCDAEVGVESWLEPSQTVDGRPGMSILIFGFSAQAVEKALVNRSGQCLMTCPTTAVFDGLPESSFSDLRGYERIKLGDQLRYFGDGYQKSKIIGDRRVWRVPVMDGEFVIEDQVGVAKGIGGGNFLILTVNQIEGLNAARRAIEEIQNIPGVITPFPGGVVRSGSKVGSKYPKLMASTSDGYCPTLKGKVTSQLPDSVQCVYEIVIDGIDEKSIEEAMTKGIQIVAGNQVHSISAGNYGGKLGKFHFHLRPLLSSDPAISAEILDG
ncbi:MAG: formylmethanofuran--tetrahydromethanopterin N-formyltransferase [Planctomycetota bacterium]